MERKKKLTSSGRIPIRHPGGKGVSGEAAADVSSERQGPGSQDESQHAHRNDETRRRHRLSPLNLIEKGERCGYRPLIKDLSIADCFRHATKSERARLSYLVELKKSCINNVPKENFNNFSSRTLTSIRAPQDPCQNRVNQSNQIKSNPKSRSRLGFPTNFFPFRPALIAFEP